MAKGGISSRNGNDPLTLLDLSIRISPSRSPLAPRINPFSEKKNYDGTPLGGRILIRSHWCEPWQKGNPKKLRHEISGRTDQNIFEVLR